MLFTLLSIPVSSTYFFSRDFSKHLLFSPFYHIKMPLAKAGGIFTVKYSFI